MILIRVEDRFGDIGWVGAVLMRDVNGPEIHIDSFILSCRAMGRGIETAVMNHLKDWCFARPGCVAMTAEYRPSAKNLPVRDLYERHGFSVSAPEEPQAKAYRLEKSSSSRSPCDWIAGHFDPN